MKFTILWVLLFIDTSCEEATHPFNHTNKTCATILLDCWRRWCVILRYALTDDFNSVAISFGRCIKTPIGELVDTFIRIEWKESEKQMFWTEFDLMIKLLTHQPWVPHICVSEMGQYWFRLWLVPCTAPSHYLNQCSLIVNRTLRKKLQWNSNRNTKPFMHENASEGVVCEMAAILSREKWVNL